MRPDDRVRILHMIEAAEAIDGFVAGRSRAIEIIGEASSRVSPETHATARAVPWAQITAMRNRLIHAYFDINHDVLWRTAIEEVPALLAKLRPLATDK